MLNRENIQHWTGIPKKKREIDKKEKEKQISKKEVRDD
jgi:hypothetical protein